MTNRQHIYLDTYHFQAYLFGKGEARRVARRLFDKLEKSRVSIKIPFVVVGELINNLVLSDIREKEKGEILHEFFRLQKRLGIDMVPLSEKACLIVNEILKIDSRLDPANAQLVSQALSDDRSTYLITTDTVLLHSASLKDYVGSMNKKRESKLRIKAEF